MFLFTKMMIKHHIKRSYMIILGIACSVAMMFCMIQMGDSIINKYKEQAMGTNLYDFHIESLSKEQADWLKAELDQEMIEASGILYSDFGDMQMKLEAYAKMEFVLCVGTKEGLEEPGLRLQEGRWSEASDEIVLEQYVCSILGVGIGDEVTVFCDLTGDPWRFRLVGIMENTPILSSSDWKRGYMNVSFPFLYESKLLTPETEEHTLIVTVNSDVDDYDSDENFEIMVKGQELLARVYGLDGYLNTVQKVGSGQVSEEELEVVKKINRQVGFNSSKEENIEEYQLQSETGNVLKALAILLAVTMVLLIFNSMHLSIVENTRELGMLRCIGMNYRQTGFIVFAENVCYCILGYGIGIVFGNIMNRLFAKNILLYLTGEPVTIRQLGSSYLLTAAVVLVSLLLAFVLSVHKILALTPIEASKYNGLSARISKVRAMEKWSCVKFAERNIGRERSKSVIVMLSMIFSMMILMLIVNTMSNVKLPEKDQKSEFSDYEIYVPLAGIIETMEGNASAEISVSEMEAVMNVTGVEELYAIGWCIDPELDMYQQNGEIIAPYIYNDELFQWLFEQNGKSELWEKDVESICVITGTYGEEEQELLDEIEETGAMVYRLENGEEGSLNVGLVLHTDYMPDIRGIGTSEVAIILTEKAASEIFGEYSYLDIMVKLDPNADDGTYTAINTIFADNEYAICGSYEVGMEKLVTDTLVIIYIAALIVTATAVTAVLNMMIIMKANLVLRRKEHGIWRALGMPLKQLKQTISMEILLMLFISYVIAVVLSFPLQCYMCVQMENFNVKGIVTGYLGVGIVSITVVYFLVMAGLKFKQTNEIMADIRED